MKLKYAPALLALAIAVTACSSVPQQMTVNGTVIVPDDVLGATSPSRTALR